MLTEAEKKRVKELHREIWDEEHSGKGGFSLKLVRLTEEMQELYHKQEGR
ncbi:hypothetical protein LCGC14_0366000 [marine sediment metagenome]|uniref:Uncharacterized protein n=1 Tax=marine sediment metagenome TaxID=412755 RepID=A0A0F9WF94_9ZZZZ